MLNYMRKVLPSELTNNIENFIWMKHISPKFMYIIHVFEADNIYKNLPPQMSFHLFVLPSELTNNIENFIGMKHISPKFMYIIHVFEADNIYKNLPPQMSFHLFFAISPPMTLLTAGALMRQLHTCARLMHGWVASAGCPPPNKSWLRQCWYACKTWVLCYKMAMLKAQGLEDHNATDTDRRPSHNYLEQWQQWAE